MKKSLIFVGMAALVLGACHKVDTVVTETPQEIGFKAISANATKANELEGTLLTKDYSIYASATQKNTAGTIENPAFFVDQEFKTIDFDENGQPTSLSEYKAVSEDPIYWPVGGVTLDFLAYAIPSKVYMDDIIKGDWSNNGDIASKVSFEWNTYEDQVDLLYAANNAVTKANYVNLAFKHAQALLAFEAKADVAGVVTINSITVNGLKVAGTFTVDNSRNDLVASWSLGEATNSLIPGSTLDLTTSLQPVGNTLLVPQQPKCNFTIEYTMGDSKPMKYTYNETRGTWEMGKKYIYQLDMKLNEIILTENVKDFVDAAVPEIPLN